MNIKKILKKRSIRAQRVRFAVKKNAQIRASVYRSAKQIYVQLIDDIQQKTIASASSISKEVISEIKASKNKMNKSEIAHLVGIKLGEKVSKLGIKQVAFDRGCYLYHGRVKALAEGIIKGGVKI